MYKNPETNTLQAFVGQYLAQERSLQKTLAALGVELQASIDQEDPRGVRAVTNRLEILTKAYKEAQELRINMEEAARESEKPFTALLRWGTDTEFILLVRTHTLSEAQAYIDAEIQRHRTTAARNDLDLQPYETKITVEKWYQEEAANV